MSDEARYCLTVAVITVVFAVLVVAPMVPWLFELVQIAGAFVAVVSLTLVPILILEERRRDR